LQNFPETHAVADNSLVLGQLAEEFTRRVRAGQLPDIDDYAHQHPDLAERIRALFPTLLFLEGMARGQPVVDTGAATVAPRSAPGTLAAGQLFNQYRIERELGRGGMGVVYEAVHVALDKRVALKVLPPLAGEGPALLERFLREARTAAGLHHTNIVPVFDIGQSDGTPYYAMQFIRGLGLDLLQTSESVVGAGAALLAAGRARSAQYHRQIAQLGIQAAEGLAHAHERGVIHRDIKPSNLLLDEEGVLWITDFGLARRVADPAMTHSGALLGTPRYMSPEQAEAARRPIDHRTDIYSLGATLYELATRRPAFTGPTPVDVLLQVIEREPVPPRQLDPAVPRDLETIILKAMAKRPGDRYASAADLAEDLRRFLGTEPIKARRIGPIGRLARWTRRNKAVAALLVSVMLTLILGAGFSIYFALESLKRELTAVDERTRAQAAENDARDHYCASLYDEARAYLHSREPGAKQAGLVLLGEAALEAARPRSHEPTVAIPTSADLRSVAVDMLCQADLLPLKDHAAPRHSHPILSADGRIAAIPWEGGKDECGLRFVDLQHRKEVGRMRTEQLGPHARLMSLSPDGKMLAAGWQDDRTVVIWDTATGKKVRSLPAPRLQDQEPSDKGDAFAGATAPRFSPDGRWVMGRQAFGSGLVFVLWELAAPGEPIVLPSKCVVEWSRNDLTWQPGAFRDDSRRFAYAVDDTTLAVFDLETKRQLKTVKVEIASDGPWGASQGRLSAPLVWCPKRSLIAFVSSSAIAPSAMIFWDLDEEKEAFRIADILLTYQGSWAFQPNGQHFAGIGRDNSLCIFSTHGGHQVLRQDAGLEGVGAQLCWTPDNRLVFAGLGGRVRSWQLFLPSVLAAHYMGASALEFSPNGQWLAQRFFEAPNLDEPTFKDKLIMVDRRTGRKMWEAALNSNPGGPPFEGGPRYMWFTDDGKLSFWPAPEGIVTFDAATGKKSTVKLASNAKGEQLPGQLNIRHVPALTPGGHVIVPRATDKTEIEVVDLRTDRKLAALSARDFGEATLFDQTDLVVSPSGRWLVLQPSNASATTRPLVVIEVASSKKVAIIDPGSGRPLVHHGVAFCHDERLFLSWSSIEANEGDDKVGEVMASVYDLPSGRLRLKVQDVELTRAGDLSPNGKLLALGLQNGKVAVWSLDSGQELFQWQPGIGRPIGWVRFTPRGELAAKEAYSNETPVLDMTRFRQELRKLNLDW
jgi:WD40 repeat protein